MRRGIGNREWGIESLFPIPYSLFPILVALLAGCAGARGPQVPSADYTREVAEATATDIAEWTVRLLEDGQYQIVRRDGPPEIYVETLWRPREPFADERERGVTASESRVLVRGRRKPNIGTAREIFVVQVTVENRVMLIGQDGWHRIPATPMFVAHAAEIARQLELRLGTGVRRYE